MPIDAPKNKLRAPIRPLDARTLCLTTLGLGFLRPAPGTWGSLPPCVMAFGFMAMGASSGSLLNWLFVVLFVASIMCIAFGKYSERRFGRKDAAEVVLDETAGQCLPLIAIPGAWRGLVSLSLPAWFEAGVLVAIAFVCFRICDIYKPWPARPVENLPHGIGILADDLVAGLYAALAMWMLMLLLVYLS